VPPDVSFRSREPLLRKGMRRHIEIWERHCGGAVVAIEAGGFVGSLLRSVTAGIILASRQRVKTVDVDEGGAGLRWLADVAGHAFDAERAFAALRGVRLA
jgi:hypothetical protein